MIIANSELQKKSNAQLAALFQQCAKEIAALPKPNVRREELSIQLAKIEAERARRGPGL
ncbi:hypothetical protein [Sphingobium sp. HWE2-09]|uniref:hypothetical protein n=1 Tax=Sphingobium sp. HWE2-09 TaxID=3108390 RepID=UPI002DD3FBFA|nr:hypothetical protein [Sphingobium sp. HWE2-09]